MKQPNSRGRTVRRVLRRVVAVTVLCVLFGGVTPAAAAEPTGDPKPVFDPTTYDENLRRCGFEDGKCETPKMDDQIGSLFGDGTIGRAGIPTSHYDLGYSDGGPTDFGSKAFGFIANMAFAVLKTFVVVAVTTVRWAFSFKVVTALATPVERIAQGYVRALNGSEGINVYELGLWCTLVAVAVGLLRSKIARSAGELAVTCGIWLMFFTFLAVPNGFSGLVTGTLDFTAQVSGGLAASTLQSDTGSGGCPAVTSHEDLEHVACPFERAIHTALIERPYDALNWGRDLGSGGDPRNPLAASAKARDRILADGPWGAEDKPREMMETAGEPCKALVEWNQKMTPDRAVGAAFVALVAFLALFLMFFVTTILFGAQLAEGCAGAVTPFAFAFGVFPGGGRVLLWKWVAFLLKAVFACLAVSIVLALYLVTLIEVGKLTAGTVWIIQGFSLIVPSLLVFAGMWKLLKGSERAAEAVGRRMAMAKIGGARDGILAAATANQSGYGHASPYQRAERRARRAIHQHSNRSRHGNNERRTNDRPEGNGREVDDQPDDDVEGDVEDGPDDRRDRGGDPDIDRDRQLDDGEIDDEAGDSEADRQPEDHRESEEIEPRRRYDLEANTQELRALLDEDDDAPSGRRHGAEPPSSRPRPRGMSFSDHVQALHDLNGDPPGRTRPRTAQTRTVVLQDLADDQISAREPE